jgi:hypothetical protein
VPLPAAQNFCGSLACIGGTSGTCNEHVGEWAGRKVICATPPSPPGQADARTQEVAPPLQLQIDVQTILQMEEEMTREQVDQTLCQLGSNGATCAKHEDAVAAAQTAGDENEFYPATKGWKDYRCPAHYFYCHNFGDSYCDADQDCAPATRQRVKTLSLASALPLQPQFFRCRCRYGR